MRTEIENLSSFEYLNDEKITPYYVSLAKCNKATATTDSICNDDGYPFTVAAERNEYVRNFYANLYKIPQGQEPAAEGCIEEFLGPEICNSAIVRDSKIPLNKRNELEQPITIEELDISAAQGNRSAAGMDGLSNCFIKKFWALLRVPLHRYLNHSLENGSLTFTFKTAKIRIIPKKGDSKKIGNWRPISLLSCLYKVLSRALNNRLKKVRDIIFSRAQKGFTDQRHIQEVLINVIEGIAHCKQNNIPACILSIDQCKAFDSVSHSYKTRVFEFFGFGPNFIHLMNTLCTNRSACVVFDDGSLSSNFDLDRGDAQGNTPSPILYNIAQQVFIFKLEMCPEIKSVFVNHLVPRPLAIREPAEGAEGAEEAEEALENQAICQEFRNESNRETDKAEAFADDTTGLSLFELESLRSLKKILSDFGAFSGLQCNVDKTVLMQVGLIEPPPAEITDLGFVHVNSIKILGMEIDQNLEFLDQNFVSIHEKIKKTISYWNRYNLTLPGRINIIKSLLISLVNHLGCFLMPKHHTLLGIQKSLDDFALGTLRVARNRICLPPESGGLGLFKLEEFLASQQCTWVIKADRSRRDNWRCDMYRSTFENCFSLSPRSVDPNLHPILHGLGLSFERIRVCHDSTNENYLHATVLQNPLIFCGPRDKRTLNPELLECEDDFVLCRKLANLTIDNCYGQNGLLTRVEFRLFFDINLTLSAYATLGRAVNHFVNRLSVNNLNDGTSVSIREELNIKKPGPKIRKLLAKRRRKPFDLGKQTTCTTFFRITGIAYIGNEDFSKIVSVWAWPGFTNRQKTFLFKFFSNILGLNTRTSHFGINVSRVCFFCSKKNPGIPNDETFIHLFYNCNTTRAWQAQFLTKCFPEFGLLPDNELKKLWFLGIYNDTIIPFIVGAMLSFQFCIWEHKLRKNVPSFHTLYNEFLSSFIDTCRHNNDVRLSGTVINYELCRTIFGARRGLPDGEE